jgi:ketosteroid isomerase-like protein
LALGVGAGVAGAQPAAAQASAAVPEAPVEAEVRQAVARFLTAFENLDWPTFRSSFEDDATVFFPAAMWPELASGRAEIEARFEQVFEDTRREATSGPPFQDLTPENLRVRVLGPDAALVTFQLRNGERLARRSIVFRRREGIWRIAHLHASNMAPAAAAAVGKGAHGRLDDPFLDNLVGDWRITRRIRGTEAQNTLHVEWVLQHQFVELRMRDVKQPPEYEAQVLVGYDPSTARYVAHWCDDFGGQYSNQGYGKRTGDAIEFTFVYPDGPFHNTFRWDPAQQTWTFLMENEKDGHRTLFAEDTAHRR